MEFCLIYQKCQLVTINSTKGPGATVSKMLRVLTYKAVIPSRFWKKQALLGEFLVHRWHVGPDVTPQ